MCDMPHLVSASVPRDSYICAYDTASVSRDSYICAYGVAMVSKIDHIIGIFCKSAL